MTDLLPCPFCGGTTLVDGSWYVDDEEVAAIECEGCKGGAPASVWNTRPDPWRYPPDMPEEGQRIVWTYRCDEGESSEVISTWTKQAAQHWRPLVRWIPVPESKCC